MKFGHSEIFGRGRLSPTRGLSITMVANSLLSSKIPTPKKLITSSLGWVFVPSVIPTTAPGDGKREFPEKKISPPSDTEGFLWIVFLVPELSREDFFAFFETSFLETLLFWSVRTSWNPTRVNEPLFRRGVLWVLKMTLLLRGFWRAATFTSLPKKSNNACNSQESTKMCQEDRNCQ